MILKQFCSIFVINFCITWIQGQEIPENSTTGEIDRHLRKLFLKIFTEKKDGPGGDFNFPELSMISSVSSANVRPKYDVGVYNRINSTAFFYDVDPFNLEAIKNLTAMLEGKGDLKEIIMTALHCRDDLNWNLWLDGIIGAILHKGNGLSSFLPLVELKPDLMLTSNVIDKAMEQSRKLPDDRTCVAAKDEDAGKCNGIENELWYFREDLMVNSHHWYWHVEYPTNIDALLDRSGELFYYMHHSMLARYHSERLSNELPAIEPLSITLNGIVKEQYYSFLKDVNSGSSWTDRPPNASFTNVQRDDVNITITEHELKGHRLTSAATSGILMTPSGEPEISLMNFEGIDIFSKTVEALDNFSANMDFYGNWHIFGHILLAFIQDPTGELELGPGVMGHTETAMRDVIFYRWHLTVDNLFKKHKDTLTPYAPRGGELQLVWPGISIEELKVKSIGRKSELPANTLYTFWRERRFDLSKGLDFKRNATISGTVDLCVDHLDHDEFEYNITVRKSPKLENSTNKATIRIFLAPRFNQKGERYSMEEQRNLFFVLDTFSITLNREINVITQSSKLSSLTLEYADSFRQLERDDFQDTGRCGCGWPQHLLIPKGKPLEGMTFDLFAMVTNGEEDQVVQDSPVNDRKTCSQGYLYCGLINQKYPDSKPMGYPFDRKVYTVADLGGRRPVANLEEYVSTIPNMNAIQVNISHEPKRKEAATNYL